ncbi:hypothetical protein PMIN06_011249 [Paraphaeosphaeria minitans]
MLSNGRVLDTNAPRKLSCAPQRPGSIAPIPVSRMFQLWGSSCFVHWLQTSPPFSGSSRTKEDISGPA